MWVLSHGWDNPLDRKWQLTLLLPGEYHGQRNLSGIHKESDVTEYTHSKT